VAGCVRGWFRACPAGAQHTQRKAPNQPNQSTHTDLSVPGLPVPMSVNPTPARSGIKSSSCAPLMLGGAIPVLFWVGGG